MKKSISLTKSRLRALDLALSIDEVLFEKFRRLNEDLQKRTLQMYRRNQVIRVIRESDKTPAIEQITKEIKTPDGIIVYIKDYEKD